MWVHGGVSNTSHVYIADIKLVKKEAKDETLWDTNSGIAALGGYNSNAVTWLESYEGETGIIRLDHDKWIHIYRGMKPIHDKAYYAGCNTLVFKVKTDDPTGQKTLTYLAEGKNYEIIVNVTGEWTEVAVPLTNVHANRTCEGTFEDFWTNYIDADTSMMWVHDGTAGSHVYIADIKLVKQEGRNNLIQAVSIAANMAKASTGSPQKKRMAMSFDEDSKKNENLLLYVVRNLVQK